LSKQKTYVRCSWQEEGRILVNPDGQVWPCCYFCNKAYYAEQTGKIDEWFSRYPDRIFHKYFAHKEELNLKNRTMEEILSHEWFTKDLPESWIEEDTRAEQCQTFCQHYVEEEE
jgi:hypothetical protein